MAVAFFDCIGNGTSVRQLWNCEVVLVLLVYVGVAALVLVVSIVVAPMTPVLSVLLAFSGYWCRQGRWWWLCAVLCDCCVGLLVGVYGWASKGARCRIVGVGDVDVDGQVWVLAAAIDVAVKLWILAAVERAVLRLLWQ